MLRSWVTWAARGVGLCAAAGAFGGAVVVLTLDFTSRVEWGWTWGYASRQHARGLRSDGTTAGITLCGSAPPWYAPAPDWQRDDTLRRCTRCRRVAARTTDRG